MNIFKDANSATIYLSNLDYNLTNNDIYQLLHNRGKINRITIVRDKVTRISKGVAFVMFASPSNALKTVNALNNTLINGRTIKCSIAKDNGRSDRYTERKKHDDKSRCFECGEIGHISYKCPKNILGDRKFPKRNHSSDLYIKASYPLMITESKKDCGNSIEEEASCSTSFIDTLPITKKKRLYKKDSYFSDEECLSE